MNPDIKQEWCRRLRDPDLEQAFGVLTVVRDGAVQCCAYGVLCEVAADAGVVKRTRIEAEGCHATIGYYDDSGGMVSIIHKNGPPPAVMEWAGLGDSGLHAPRFAWRPGFGDGLDRDEKYGIGALNDDLGLSLGCMADLIEEEL